MSYTDDAVLAKLATLSETQDSIVTVAQWIMFHRRHAEHTVQLWLTRLKDSSSHKRLSLIYLANEICQQSKARRKADFLVAFSPAMAEATGTCYKGAPTDVQQRVRRVVEVWRDREVFEESIQVAIENRLDEIDKARGGAPSKSGFGGSIFSGSSSSTMPSDLTPLIAPQQAVNKQVVTSKTPTATATQEYTRLMSSAATVPAPPVHAAQLNGLLKNLVNAEGAVDQCVKARVALVHELQQILDKNKTALAADEEQLLLFRARKQEVDEKKRDVEMAIMQGLSNDDSAPAPLASMSTPTPTPTPSSASNDAVPHHVASTGQLVAPDRPEVEALTPPSLGAPEGPEEPEVSTSTSALASAAVAMPQFSPDAAQQTYKAMVTTGANGSKKRRLDTDEEGPGAVVAGDAGDAVSAGANGDAHMDLGGGHTDDGVEAKVEETVMEDQGVSV